jgi:photoactive yellow protein
MLHTIDNLSCNNLTTNNKENKMSITFEQTDLLPILEGLDDTGLDSLDFGVIGFNSDNVVCRYNAYESRAAALAPEKALGLHVFTGLAQCMNNYLVAQRFDDSKSSGETLDVTIDYVLTWRMRPTKVKLRMLYSPEYPVQYVLLHRLV